MKLMLRLMVVAGLFVAFPVYAEPLDLSSAFQKAVGYDAQLRAAHADNLVSKEEIAKARSQFRPSVHLNLSRGRNETKSTNLVQDPYTGVLIPQYGNQFYNSKTYAFSLQQPLFNLSSYSEYKQAKAIAAKSDAELQKEEKGLIVRVAEAYCNALYSEDNLEFSRVHIKASQEQLQQTKKRHEKGFGTITEVSESEAAYDMALAEGVDIINGLENNRRELEHLTGFYPVELCKLIPEKMVLARPEPANVELWVELGHSGNNDVLAARQEIQIARKEVDKQRATRYPVLNLVGSRTYSDSDNNYTIGSIYDTYSIGLQMSMPIYTGGYVSSSVRQAQAKRLKAQEQLSWKERGVESDVRKNYSGVISSISQIHAYEQAVKSGEIAFKGTQQGFLAGLRTNSEVLDAEQKLLSNMRNLAKSRYQYILYRLQLKESVGSLSESDVDEINSWLGAQKK